MKGKTEFLTIILLALVGNGLASFLSVNAQSHLFLKDVDFETLIEDDDDGTVWKESWYLPIVMVRTPSVTSEKVCFFVRIQGKGFVNHNIKSYGLHFANPITNDIIFSSSSFVNARSGQTLEFTVDVPQSVANSVFMLNITHFSRPVPYEPLPDYTGPALNTVDGTLVPRTKGRHVFLTDIGFPGSAVGFLNTTCTLNAAARSHLKGREFVALVSTPHLSAYSLAANTGYSPSFPSPWVSGMTGSVVYNPTQTQYVSPFADPSPRFAQSFSSLNGEITRFWTGSFYTGVHSGFSCNNWSDSGDQLTGTTGEGRRDTWLYSAAFPCRSMLRVLCLEAESPDRMASTNIATLLAHNRLSFTPH